MSTYIKPIPETPIITGKDAVKILKQGIVAPSPESIEKNKKMLEIRKRIIQK